MSCRFNLDEMTSHDIWSLSTDDLVELAVKYRVDVPYSNCIVLGDGSYADPEVDEDELAHRLDLLRTERLAEAAVNENR